MPIPTECSSVSLCIGILSTFPVTIKQEIEDTLDLVSCLFQFLPQFCKFGMKLNENNICFC